MSRRRLLVVQHQDSCTLAAFDEWLRSAGVEPRIVRPYAGDSLPAGLDGFAGLLVLGGSAAPTDDESWPWLPGTRALLRQAVAEDVPALGICLGHQLLAVACGGRVERNPAGRWMGVVSLDLTPAAAGDPLFAGIAPGAVGARSHQDLVVELPPGATPLAEADGISYAFRVGANAWGVQFHPEATAAVMADWAGRLGAEFQPAADEVEAAELELAASTGRPLALAFAERLRAVSPCGGMTT